MVAVPERRLGLVPVRMTERVRKLVQGRMMEQEHRMVQVRKQGLGHTTAVAVVGRRTGLEHRMGQALVRMTASTREQACMMEQGHRTVLERTQALVDHMTERVLVHTTGRWERRSHKSHS